MDNFKNKIISFYSFKGGVGRSQLLVNLAAFLCFYENKKVLLVDWDLEAPGLEYFFDFEISKIEYGLIELFEDYIRLVRSGKEVTTETLPRFKEFYSLAKSERGGIIDLFPAANYNAEDYSHRINNFDWFDFYDQLDGKYYIEFIKEELKKTPYDFIFIDSRTGYSDYLGICNIQLPDVNIIVIAPSKQNMNGAFNITEKIVNHPYTLENRAAPIVLPVFSRIDLQHGDKYNEWVDFFLKKFNRIISNTLKTTNNVQLSNLGNAIDVYVRNTTINYDVGFAYGETLKFNTVKDVIQPGSIEEKITAIWKSVIGNEPGYNYLPNLYDSKNAHFLTPPPFSPDIFLGRKQEIQEIKDLLFSGISALVLVTGQGGIGKTILAAQYFHEFHKEYSHLAWIHTEGDLGNDLLQLANNIELSFPKNASKEERLGLLQAKLAELSSPSLLIIDGANDIGDVSKYYTWLRRLPNFHILLTSRISELEQASSYKIEGLPEYDALELFKKYYPKLNVEEESLFQQIRLAVGGNTLVIEMLAKNLTSLNRLKNKYSLSGLWADLQEKGLLKLTQSAQVSTNYSTKDGSLIRAKPEEIIGAMYDLNQLVAVERKLLSVFAVLPAENIAFSMLETLLPKFDTLEETALMLSQKGWIEFNEATSSFKCSPVVQEITRKKNTYLSEDCFPLISLLISKLEYQTGTGHLENTTYEEAFVFARYAESILANINNDHSDLARLYERIGTFYNTIGDLNNALRFFEQYFKLLKKLVEKEPEKSTSKSELVISYQKLGDTWATLGDLQKALQFYEDHARLTKELFHAFPSNVSFKNGLAIAYLKIGEIWAALGDLQKARHFYGGYNQLEKELYEAFPDDVSFKNGLAIAYSKLGETWAELGDLQKALKFYEDETILFKDLFEAFPGNVSFKNGLAVSYSKLGKTWAALGDLQKALQFYKERSRLGKELYEAFPGNVSFKNGLAISYEKLGQTWAELGDLQKALQFYEDDAQLTKELHEAFPGNVSFKNGLAISYEKLGQTWAELGDLQKALQFYEDDAQLTKELYEAFPGNVSFKNGLAVSYSKLGQTWAELGDLQKALQFYEEYNQLEKELYESFSGNVSFKNNLAISYSKLAAFYRDLQPDAAKARTYFEQCLQLWKELTEDFPDYVEFKENFNWVKKQMEKL